jgi:peroxiredoxin
MQCHQQHSQENKRIGKLEQKSAQVYGIASQQKAHWKTLADHYDML